MRWVLVAALLAACNGYQLEPTAGYGVASATGTGWQDYGEFGSRGGSEHDGWHAWVALTYKAPVMLSEVDREVLRSLRPQPGPWITPAPSGDSGGSDGGVLDPEPWKSGWSLPGALLAALALGVVALGLWLRFRKPKG